MKRFHVHLHVADLAQSINFYNQLFAAEPARQESDYAKWMLVDPPVNFAISTRGKATGIDHLGIQVDRAEDLAEMKARAEAAEMVTLDEGTTTCCYARSEKHWVTDPQGVAWEQFHTLANIPVFREGEGEASGACCTPAAEAVAESQGCCAATPAGASRGKAVAIPVKSAGGCC